MISKDLLAQIHDAGHGTYLGPCPECKELQAMPSPDSLEAEALRNKISQLQSEVDRLRRRTHLLETLLGEMLEDKLRNPPRRRSVKPSQVNLFFQKEPT